MALWGVSSSSTSFADGGCGGILWGGLGAGNGWQGIEQEFLAGVVESGEPMAEHVDADKAVNVE